MIQPMILAAGMGTRMGSNKALLSIDGVPALAVVLRTIRHAGLRSPIVVLGHHADAVRAAVCLGSCTVAVNERPDQGLSRSMKLGLEHIDAAAAGVLVFHVDMPYLATSTIRALAQAVAGGANLAAPFYKGRRGFPVYFSREATAGLILSLHGDSGGRQFLMDHASDVVPVAVDDAGCVYDIDHPSDLAAWEGRPSCAIKG